MIFSWVQIYHMLYNVNKNNVTLLMNVSVWLNLFLYKREKEIKEKDLTSSPAESCIVHPPGLLQPPGPVLWSARSQTAKHEQTPSNFGLHSTDGQNDRHIPNGFVYKWQLTTASCLPRQTLDSLTGLTFTWAFFTRTREPAICSALNSNLSGIYSLCQWERFYSVIWAVQH